MEREREREEKEIVTDFARLRFSFTLVYDFVRNTRFYDFHILPLFIRISRAAELTEVVSSALGGNAGICEKYIDPAPPRLTTRRYRKLPILSTRPINQSKKIIPFF